MMMHRHRDLIVTIRLLSIYKVKDRNVAKDEGYNLLIQINSHQCRNLSL